MKISELIDHLEDVKKDRGDIEVYATCDGWLPPEISIEMQRRRDAVVLYGKRRVKESLSENIEVLNAG